MEVAHTLHIIAYLLTRLLVFFFQWKPDVARHPEHRRRDGAHSKRRRRRLDGQRRRLPRQPSVRVRSSGLRSHGGGCTGLDHGPGSARLFCVTWRLSSVRCLRLPPTNQPFYSHYPSVLWRCWLGGRNGIRPVKTECWGTGGVICLERGANDLHMVQLMPLPPHNLLLQ